LTKSHLTEHRFFPYLLFIVIGIGLGFAYSLLFLLIHPSIFEIGAGEFWIEETLPLVYWIGMIVVTTSIFLMMRFLGNASYSFLLVLSSAILMIGIRMVFPIISASPILYEPDAYNYITVVDSWLKSGVDFGKAGNYQHDYPLAYLLAFFFTKLGVPIDVFFRFAPLFVYAIDIVIMYFIYNEVSFENKKVSSAAVFLFSLSSLGYWVSVQYCPDLIGTVFYLLSLYLCVKFVRKHTWEITAIIPVCISIFLLILSHHLSTLYLTLTLLGLSLSTGMNKSPGVKEKWIKFLVLGIFTYTLWFAYGTLMYPSFFNIYVYFQFSGSPISLAKSATLLDNITFAIYPAFILVLFAYSFAKEFKIRKWSLTSFFEGLKNIGLNMEGSGILPIYSFGYIFVAVFFVIGFMLPLTFPLRVLEVLLIGMYPLSSQTLLKIYSANPSRKRKLQIIIYCVLIFVMLTSIHRYYRQIQGRVTGK